jgi:hypothetical protein
VGPGQHLDRLSQRAVARDLAVVVAVGADQIGQHLGVPSVGLGPGAAVAAAIAADDLWVDRIDLVAGRQQCPDQQASVGLDPDRHLPGLLGMGGDQGMQLPHPCQAIGDPASCQDTSVLVEQAQVMMGLAPVDPEKHHGFLLRSDLLS